MVFGCSKSHSWTRNSFPGGKSYSPPMLYGPVLPVMGSPYMGAAALPAIPIPTYSSMVPVAVQQPSPVIQILPPPVIQVTPSPVVAALPPTQPAPHVPSPIIQGSIPVPQSSPPQVIQSINHDHHLASTPTGVLFSAPLQHQEQQRQGSPGKFTVNLYVNTPEHRSRQLDDRSPSPTSQLQLLEHQQEWQQQQQQQQEWQQRQHQQQQEWQRQQQQQQQQWQERQQHEQQQWQQWQLRQRGRPQSARPPTTQPPTPSSLSIHIASIATPQPRQPGSIHITTPTPPSR